LAGCILLGIAPCTAMVLVWGYLAKGNDGHTLVMVAINSLTMLLLYGPLGGFLLGVGRLPVPWQALLLSIAIYVALPLVAGYLSRKWIISTKGQEWFNDKFLHFLTPVTIIALLITLVLLFSFKGNVILSNPLTILWIAVPLFIQTNLIFWLAYALAKFLKLRYHDAAPSAMIGASNHFEVAIATATMLFGLSSGAALATVVGVLIEVPLWRSYLAGCILLGIAPCTAMVLVWGYLAKGNDGHTLVMVAINSLTMLLLYGPLGGFLLGVGRLPVPWQALLLSITIYVALPLVAGYLSRKWIISTKGQEWFNDKFLHFLTPVTIIALLITLVLLFSFKGNVILSNPLTILWIAIPLFIQTNLIFWLAYALAKFLKLRYHDAAPSAMIGASNHFEVAIATATMLFGLSSGAALATVVGVLIEVPLMLMLVKICLRTQNWFAEYQNVAA